MKLIGVRRGNEFSARHSSLFAQKKRHAMTRLNITRGKAVMIGAAAVMMIFSGFSIISTISSYNRASSEYDRLAAIALSSANIDRTFEENGDPSDAGWYRGMIVRDSNGRARIPGTTVSMSTSAKDLVVPAGRGNVSGSPGSDYPDMSVDWERLKAEGVDAVAWRDIGFCNVSYPVVQGSDNSYYLTHTATGQDNQSGAIFIDSAASPDLDDQNTFIFGHNMKDGSMFGKLKTALTNSDTVLKDPYIYIYLPDGYVRIYKIFSFYITDVDSEMYTSFGTDYARELYVENALALSAEDMNTDPAGKIITLSTCHGQAGGTERMLMHATCEGTYLIEDRSNII